VTNRQYLCCSEETGKDSKKLRPVAVPRQDISYRAILPVSGRSSTGDTRSSAYEIPGEFSIESEIDRRVCWAGFIYW